MKKNIFALLFIALGVIVSTNQAQAQRDTESDIQSLITTPRPVENASEWKPHVGVLIGAAVPEGRGMPSNEVGVDFGYQFYIPYSIGGEFIHSRIDDGFDIRTRDTIWLKAVYNFGGTIPVLRSSYAGFGIGAVIESDGTSLALAPMVGFDIPVQTFDTGAFVTLGANSRVAIVSNDDVDTFSIGGVVKYWY